MAKPLAVGKCTGRFPHLNTFEGDRQFRTPGGENGGGAPPLMKAGHLLQGLLRGRQEGSPR